MTAALAVEVTSETTARVSGGSGTTDVELAAGNENALFHAIEEFAKTEAADSGESVEVSVSGFGATTRLTVTPEGHVAVSGPPPAPVAVPTPTVDEPVTVCATAVNPPRPLAPTQDQHSDTPHVRHADAEQRPTTSLLAAPQITSGSNKPARRGIRGRLNAVLNLRLAPKAGSAEMRHRTAVAAITGPIPDFSVITLANPKGGVGKTPLAAGLAAVIAEHRGAGTLACADLAEIGGSLADRVAVPPRQGQDVSALLTAAATARGSIRPSTLSRYLVRQPSGEDIIAGNQTNTAAALEYDDGTSLADVLAQHREILIADTGNSSLAGSWQWATAAANVLVVPVPLRRDAAAAAHRMLLDIIATAGPHVLAHAVVVITDGPGDAPMVETEAVDAFIELGVRAVLRMPFEPLFASGERIVANQLRRNTTDAMTVLAATVIGLIAGAPD
ncbi:chromosome partitioning protein ParA (plasmid) [Rhodococcus erythropolis]|uniref:chromosome partitioning protein ParA n=1 Tax=Rhodococcus erythropolis TaxID=1833 RepID=UPI00061B6B93|nr:chromosome partitioning protein ParA [Rhodococcus erythropolis]AKE01177.1 chromosome partitioning protein ParA [Rhodococcus erythropolis]